jgi:hypothetical protein
VGLFDRIGEKLDSMLASTEAPAPSVHMLTPSQARLQADVQRRLMQTGAFETVQTLSGSFGLLARRQGGQAVDKLELNGLARAAAAAGPGGRAAAIDRFVSGIVGGAQERATGVGEFRGALRTVVRPASQMCLPELIDDLGAYFVWRPVSELLVELLALDGDTIQMVPPERLEREGMDSETAFALGRQNVARTAAPAARPYDGFDCIGHTDHDGCESSRALVPGWLDTNTGHFEGPPLVCVPCADVLMAVSEADTPAIAALLEACREVYDQDARPVSPALYRVGADGWFPWVPEPSHPAFAAATMALTLERAHVYADQKEALEEYFAAEGDDVFLASVEAVQTQSGMAYTRAVWPRPVPTWLPRVDAVILINGDDPNDESILVPWDALEQVVGHLWEAIDGCGPRRYRTLGWPDAGQLEELRRLEGAPTTLVVRGPPEVEEDDGLDDIEDEVLDDIAREMGVDPDAPATRLMMLSRLVLLPGALGLDPDAVDTDAEPLGFALAPLLEERVLVLGGDIVLVSPELAAEADVDLEELMEVAIANSAVAVEEGRQPARMPILVFEEDGLGHGMLHDDVFMDELRETLGPELLIGVPDPDTLLVGAAGDPRVEARLLQEALARYKAADFAVSGELYTLTQDGLRAWVPARGHPAEAGAREAAALIQLNVYGQQRDVMLPWLARDGALELAELEAIASPHGGVVMATVWDGREERLLPQGTLLVVALRSGRLHVPWADALEVLGDSVELIDAYGPPLLRTRRATPDQLMALDARKVGVS